MHLRLLPLVLGMLALVGTGCDFCLPAGNPDSPPDYYLMGLDVQVESGGSAFELRRAPALRRAGYQSDYVDTLERHSVHVDPQGTQALIGRTLFQIPSTGPSLSEVAEDPGTPLPDSLNSCTFAHQHSDLVCGVVAADTLIHPETGRRIPVQAARARLAQFSAPGTRRTILRSARAEFTGPFDYRSPTFAAPALSLDDQRIAVVRRMETHHLVRDSSGAIVDDVVQRVDRRLLVFDRSQPGTPRRTLTLPSGVDTRLRVALAPDGGHVAVEIDERIRHAPVEDGSVRQVEGRNPRFTGPGGHMVATTGYDEMTIYDLGTGAIQSLSGVSAFSPHPRSDQIYYVADDTLNVVGPSLEDAATTGVLRSRLIQQLNDDIPRDSKVDYGFRVYHLAPLLDHRRVMPFGMLRRQLLHKGGC